MYTSILHHCLVNADMPDQDLAMCMAMFNSQKRILYWLMVCKAHIYSINPYPLLDRDMSAADSTAQAQTGTTRDQNTTKMPQWSVTDVTTNELQ